jgi:tRNA threonylcarbamoyladenosine biosynthesis protein TsaE
MSQTISFTVDTLADTTSLGKQIATQIQPGDIIFLTGDLGAGKTTLTQAIGVGLQVSPDEYITSPTFSLLHEYRGSTPIYHMDLYRIGSEEEIEELGFEEYLYGDGVSIIEWPERLGDLTPKNRITILLESSGEGRRVTITGHGSMASRTPLFKP